MAPACSDVISAAHVSNGSSLRCYVEELRIRLRVSVTQYPNKKVAGRERREGRRKKKKERKERKQKSHSINSGFEIRQ